MEGISRGQVWLKVKLPLSGQGRTLTSIIRLSVQKPQSRQLGHPLLLWMLWAFKDQPERPPSTGLSLLPVVSSQGTQPQAGGRHVGGQASPPLPLLPCPCQAALPTPGLCTLTEMPNVPVHSLPGPRGPCLPEPTAQRQCPAGCHCQGWLLSTLSLSGAVCFLWVLHRGEALPTPLCFGLLNVAWGHFHPWGWC